MRRRKLNKFIPTADRDFALTAQQFAWAIERDPARFYLDEEDARRIRRDVDVFRHALKVSTNLKTRTKYTLMEKDEARRKAEQIVSKYGNFIRGNFEISRADKIALRIKERSSRLTKQKCPKTPPHLEYVKSMKAGDGWPLHVLRFRADKNAPRDAKPAGAVRLELFVELISTEDPIPTRPGQHSGSWPCYLRSFTRSPMEVAFPMPREPRRIVYFGRWADSTGEVGPWSNAAVATLEGCAEPKALGYRGSEQRMVVTVLSQQRRMLEQGVARDDRALPAPAAA